MVTNDTADVPHVCEICDEPFETESELTRHVRNVGIVD